MTFATQAKSFAQVSGVGLGGFGFEEKAVQRFDEVQGGGNLLSG